MTNYPLQTSRNHLGVLTPFPLGTTPSFASRNPEQFKTPKISSLRSLRSLAAKSSYGFTGATPSNVIFTGLIKPFASNSIRSMHVTR